MSKNNRGPYYSTSELAKLIGVSKNTLIRWEDEGVIPKPLRDGRGWRVWTKDTLERIIEIKKSKDLTQNLSSNVDKNRLRIYVIGYGNQGTVWAKNLRDSGCAVTVLLRDGSSSVKKVTNDGFEVQSLKNVLADSNEGVFCLLIPDEQHKEFFKTYSKYIKPNFVFVFAHGFSVGYECITFNARKILLAPKAVAKVMRLNYLDDKYTPAVCSVENLKEKNIVESLALALKLSPLIKSSFIEETISDLFTEQMIICGGVPAIIVETFNMLKKKGISEQVALQECLYELSYMLEVIKEKGIAGMYDAISPVAMAGGFKIWQEIDKGRSLIEIMENSFNDIESKKFLSSLAGSNKKNISDKVKRLSKDFDFAVEKSL